MKRSRGSLRDGGFFIFQTLKKPRILKRCLTPWFLFAPAGFFLGVLIFASLMILRISLGMKGLEWDVWTLQNFRDIGQSLYLKSIFLTFKLAFLSAVIVIILGYPLSLFMARIRNRFVRLFMTFVILLPLFLNLLFQSYGWLIILSPVGLLNQLLMFLGITDHPVLFLFNQFGVLIGLVQTSFPLAVLPMASSLKTIPKSLEEAAMTLGASRWAVLWRIVLPLSLPGIIGGSLLVFAFNASAFVIPLLLGGRRVSMLAVLIRDQMGPLINWPFGGANAVVLVASTLTVLAVYQYLTRKLTKIQGNGRN